MRSWNFFKIKIQVVLLGDRKEDIPLKFSILRFHSEKMLLFKDLALKFYDVKHSLKLS